MIQRMFGLMKLLPVVAILAVGAILAGCSSSTISLPSITPTASPSVALTATPAPSSTPVASATPPATTASPSATPTASATPTLTPIGPTAAIYIVSPLYNVPVLPGDITVKVKVSNFNLVNKIGQTNVPGEGHLIYYLDVTPPTTPGKPAMTADGTFAETADASYIWPNVAAGNHFLYVQLVNNDGSPLTPAATASEPLPVQAPTPSPTASTSPTPTP